MGAAEKIESESVFNPQGLQETLGLFLYCSGLPEVFPGLSLEQYDEQHLVRATSFLMSNTILSDPSPSRSLSSITRNFPILIRVVLPHTYTS